ncbi:hypothetical protein EV138_4361 [Kribbella voronezhensis]|uniref:Subtilisin inhibitor-like n=1 Tax=Kribbella voronezhensis TaxID=2512212 RepID=A0A4R7TGM6_9ACTN|nr:hypothetical protein [Kribbella voronezhensis]TDU90766.1 hypothetical protein EV138_4361 [Kribbella voronezhensis]
MKRQHTLGALAAIVLAMTLTGCGSGAEDKQVASGNGSQAATGPSSAPASLSQDEKGVKFAQCLRENGIDVKDPEPGKGIQLKLDPSSGIRKEDVDKAMEACKQYDPQADGSNNANPQAEENGRKFAECMRKNGVEKFPDPKPGQRGIVIDKATADDPDLQKAQETCQPILAGK